MVSKHTKMFTISLTIIMVMQKNTVRSHHTFMKKVTIASVGQEMQRNLISHTLLVEIPNVTITLETGFAVSI